MGFYVPCPHCGGKVPSKLFSSEMAKRKHEKHPVDSDMARKMRLGEKLTPPTGSDGSKPKGLSATGSDGSKKK